MYRVLKSLYVGNRDGADENGNLEPGMFTSLDWLTEGQIERLTVAGAVSKVAPPPLSELPGWKRRAERLAEQGINDVAEFMEADAGLVAKTLKLKEQTIKRWQAEAKRWLVVEEKRG